MGTGIERLKYIPAVVLYGTIGLFLRNVSFPSEFVAFCRGIIGSGFILAFLAARHRKPDLPAIKKNFPLLLISGICLGLNWVFLFAAYMETTVAIASLCNYMAPIIVVIVAPAVLREKLNLKKLPFVAMAFVGIVLVSGVLDGGSGSTLGVILGLIAALCFVCIVLCNRRLRDIGPMDRSVVQLFVSALIILPYIIVNNYGKTINADMHSVLIVLLLGVVHTGIAYCLYFSGLGSLPVHTVSLLGYLEPVVSVLCSALILHEPMSIWGWIGAVMVVVAAAASEIME